MMSSLHILILLQILFVSHERWMFWNCPALLWVCRLNCSYSNLTKFLKQGQVER